ncbi:DUF3179 domain-containing protein, partial [Candidatus Uhrbacteria bacterium]|nr:DUF3179 domain-containing protein [Candidatus Uhrbacteria bacterium]
RDIIFIVIVAGLLILGGIIIWRQVSSVPSISTVTEKTAGSASADDRAIINDQGLTDGVTSTMEKMSDRDILITDGIKHSIPLERVVSGGPPKDGIPAIRSPKFESVEQASTYLRDDGLGIGIHSGEVERFYPFQILVWHEIVNDMVGGVPVAITYCPLCGTAIVYEGLVNGEAEDFGVSGKLYDSNLLMYDRSTDSYWSQALGEAVVGELTGTKLNLYQNFENITWGEWKQAHPDGEVLSRDTGYVRDYTREPYGNYGQTPELFFPVSNDDTRLPRKEPIVGLVIDGVAKAYQMSLFDEVSEIEDVVNGQDVLLIKQEGEGVRGHLIDDKGEKIKIGLNYSFWFSWAATHPATTIYK